MQHHVTGHHECSQTKQQVSHPATVSKRGAAQGRCGRLKRFPPLTERTQSARQPTVRTIQNATQCNTMQHNVTRRHREQQVSHPATVSKKGAAQGGADRSGACRPTTKRTQSARQPTIRAIQNATQCNTMLLAISNALSGGEERSSACRPTTERTQSAPQPTIRTIQNATHNVTRQSRIHSEGTAGVASLYCLKKGRSPTVQMRHNVTPCNTKSRYRNMVQPFP
jgi:hypothetical protein